MDPPPASLASLVISPDPVTIVNVGDEVTLVVTGRNASGGTIATGTITFSTSNAAVATVDAAGKVKAVGLGTATITATASNGVTKSVVVQVSNASFNVNAIESCTNPTLRTGKLVATSARAFFMEDTQNPAGGFTAADYNEFATLFESLVWPTLTENFAAPTDIDNNGRVIVLFTTAVNALSPANSNSVVGGFFFSRDLFPKTVSTPRLQACAGSNFAEMFYMLAPDPEGTVNNNKRSTAQVKAQTVGVIGHEFEHLINASRRLYINTAATRLELVYVEEGLAHIAEELLFYRASGLTPMSNIDLATLQGSPARVNAFNSYMASNAGRQKLYHQDPSSNSPYAADDDLETRGATWSWFRYLADVAAPAAAEATCSQPVSLSVGGFCAITAPGQVDLQAGSIGREFTLVAVAEGSGVNVTATPSTVIAPTGPPSPYEGMMRASFSRLSAATPLRQDMTFHVRLRERERRELTGRVSPARADYEQVFRASRLASTASFSSAAAEDVWAKFANATDTGFKTLETVFGVGVKSRTKDWATAHYTDDAGIGVLPARYTHPSWDWRSIYPALGTGGAFSLKTLNLTSAQTVTLVDGGAAYFRAGIAPTVNGRVTFTSGGSGTPAALKLVVVRTK